MFFQKEQKTLMFLTAFEKIDRNNINVNKTTQILPKNTYLVQSYLFNKFYLQQQHKVDTSNRIYPDPAVVYARDSPLSVHQ